MATVSTDTPQLPKVRLRLQRRVAYMIAAGLMATMGTLFSTAAFAAGVSKVDVLAMLFFMGAGFTLFMLALLYLSQAHTAR